MILSTTLTWAFFVYLGFFYFCSGFEEFVIFVGKVSVITCIFYLFYSLNRHIGNYLDLVVKYVRYRLYLDDHLKF